MTYYFDLRCSRCDKLLGYHCGSPHGFILCCDCKEIAEQEDQP